MSNTATRLVNLIMLLQRRPNQKTAALAAELGISVRTLHRYYAMLDEMGVPVYSERGPNGGFSLVRGYRMPPLVFTPEEAVAVYLGVGLVEETWGQLYREAARGALAKLENVLPDEQRHEAAWARRTLMAIGLNRADLEALAPTLEKLRRAARERRQVSMTYQARGQAEDSSRCLSPYALLHRWGWWYVIGFCHLRQEVRTFRADRIANLTLLDSTFEIPASFNLREYLEQEQSAQQGIPVTLRFEASIAALARENRLSWESLQEQPDGSLLAKMQSWNIPWAVSLAFSYGPGVTVLDPPEAVEAARQWANTLAAQYAKDNPEKHEETRRKSLPKER
ncbi:MAG TPA: YafY family protein [Anaerolineaceae bacterium]|nr:YafY family protein [Anaerolineaceae bacterium]